MKTVKEYKAEDTSGAKLEATPEGLAWFQEAAYGLSVHWGLYSLIGHGEWVMHTEKIEHEVYRRLMKRFRAERFSAEEWADLMLESGQKFLFITTKHHDGFSLWDTKLSDFKVTNTPLGRDVIGELSEALSARGLTLCYYYSLLDWTHPAYRNDWPAYVEYYQAQLKELLTDYGRVGAVAFDGYWPRQEFDESDAYFAPGGKWDLAGTFDLIHGLQADTVIINNTHILPLKGEDCQIWELDLPGENKIGFNTTEVGDKAKAVWWNVNSGWSYTPASHSIKSAEDISAALQKANALGATFLLNVGPRPWGDIHPDEARVLREIKRGLKR